MEESFKYLLKRKQGLKSSKVASALSLPVGLQQQMLKEVISLQQKQADGTYFWHKNTHILLENED